jgi:hypothetical protein
MTSLTDLLAVDTLPITPDPMEVRIRADMLPAHTWGSNLRGLLTPHQWDALRIPICERAGNACEVCGARIFGPRRRRPDCHERWVFAPTTTDGWVQRLDRLVALCPRCHQVQHTGAACNDGRRHEVTAQLVKVNNWSLAQAEQDIERAWTRWRMLNKYVFDLDLRALHGVLPLPDYPDLYIPAAAR